LRRQANAPFSEPSVGEPALLAAEREGVAELLAKEIADSLCADPNADRLARHMISLRLGTFEVSRHRVLPVPSCPECGGPSALPEERSVDRGEPTVEAFAELVDAKVGVIHALVLESAETTGVTQPVVATAVSACAPDGAASPNRLPAGWGKGTTPLAAVLSAAGEALERYAASLPDDRRLVRAKLGHFPADQVIDPRTYPLFHESQYRRPDFPYVRFDPHATHAWLAGRQLWDGGLTWIPAVFCYLSMTVEQRQNFCSGSSNGLAAYSDPDEAALRAVLELVERDAFLTAWHTRQPGRAVPVDGAWDADLLAIVDGIARLGGDVRLVMLSGAGDHPVAVCLAFGDGVQWPGVTLGLGADPSPRAAIRKAVLELGQTGPYLRSRLRSGTPVPPGPDAVREMIDHALYYFPPSRAAAFAFLRDASASIRYADLETGRERSLKACGKRLEDAGVRVLLADVTSADLALTPFKVMRAVSPDLQPISFGFGAERALTLALAARAVPIPDEWISPIW